VKTYLVKKILPACEVHRGLLLELMLPLEELAQALNKEHSLVSGRLSSDRRSVFKRADRED